MSKSKDDNNGKTSDEILNELFNSLNLPVSPLNSEKLEKSKKDNKKVSVEVKNEEGSDTDFSNVSSTDQEIDKILEITNVPDKETENPPITKSHKKKKKLKKSSESSKHKKKKKKKSSKSEHFSDSKSISESETSKGKKSSSCNEKKVPHKSHKDSDSHDNKTKSSYSQSYSKSRSRSRSKSYVAKNKSRSRSRSKSYVAKDKSRSRSKSKSKYSSRSKSRYNRSRSRSRSSSRKNGSHKGIGKHSSSSHSPSPKSYHKKHKRKSKSWSPSKKRKRSQSPKITEDPLDIWKKTKLASLQKNSLESKKKTEENFENDINTDNNQGNEKLVPVTNIPLPISSEVNSTCSDPSCIPLPNQNKSNDKKDENLSPNLVPEGSSPNQKKNPSNQNTQKTQESNIKSQDKRDDGKGKTIVIKSLKDSVLFQQLEEAKKKSETESTQTPEERLSVSSSPVEESEKSLNKDKEDLIEESSPTEKPSENEIKDGIEDGEIVEEDELDKKKEDLTDGVKKSKKAKKSSKKNKKDSNKKNEDEKHSSRSRRKSRSKSRTKNKSRSKSTSRDEKTSSSTSCVKKSKSKDKSRKRSRSHSRSRSRSKRTHSHNRERRSRSRSRSYSRRKRRKRSSSRDERSPDCVDSLRDKATRKRLLEVARKNAVYLMKNNCLPPVIEKESMRATGKTVEELTSFCKQLVSKEYSDDEMSDPSLSPDEQDMQFDKPFIAGRHPFAVKDSKPIMMNIRNAPMLPTKTNAERLADTSKLREQFPVSSGSQHRNVAESGWVPVEKEEAKEKETVFPSAQKTCLDISQLVSNRLSAMRRLQDNPSDKEAMRALTSSQKEMQNWALSKQIPGQFTGSTGARILSPGELSSGYQAWARKEQFKEANPVSSHFGMKMLQKMGWNPGEGLGKNKEGQIEPLVLDVKMDKKGLTAPEEMTPRRTPIPLAKSLAGKHPVSALVEICSKRKWPPPVFEIVFDGGPDHKKNFLMKVHVNNQTYKPAIAASTKKIAKANAAAACLQALGLIPKDPTQPQGTLNTTENEDNQEPESDVKSFSPPPLPPGMGQNPLSLIPPPPTTLQSQQCMPDYMQQPVPYFPVSSQVPSMHQYMGTSQDGYSVQECYQNAFHSYPPQTQVGIFNVPQAPINTTGPPEEVAQPSVPGEEDVPRTDENVEVTTSENTSNTITSTDFQSNLPKDTEVSSSTKDPESDSNVSSSVKVPEIDKNDSSCNNCPKVSHSEEDKENPSSDACHNSNPFGGDTQVPVSNTYSESNTSELEKDLSQPDEQLESSVSGGNDEVSVSIDYSESNPSKVDKDDSIACKYTKSNVPDVNEEVPVSHTYSEFNASEVDAGDPTSNNCTENIPSNTDKEISVSNECPELGNEVSKENVLFNDKSPETRSLEVGKISLSKECLELDPSEVGEDAVSKCPESIPLEVSNVSEESVTSSECIRDEVQ